MNAPPPLPAAPASVKLTAHYGLLHTPHDIIPDDLKKIVGVGLDGKPTDALLVVHYDAGDADTVKWPRPNIKNLRAALYGARETGIIPAETKVVILPNGKEFSIE